MTGKQIVTRFHLLLLIGLIALAVVGYFKIPEATGLPVHWGFDGKPDQFWPRNQALLIFPIIGLVCMGLFAAIGRWAPTEQVEPGRYVLEAALAGVLLLNCAIEFGLILIGVGSEIDMVRIIGFAMAIVLLGLGVTLPTSAPNAYAGVRLPWTVRDPGNWKITHRVTGILFIIGGIALAATSYFESDPRSLLAVLFIALIVPVVVGGVVSFALSRR